MSKVYSNDRLRYDPATGEDLGKIDVQKIVNEYSLELPKEASKRKKLIDEIIESANGTYPENIKYYYKDTDAGLRCQLFI
jgi:hypothetical protein